MELHLRGPWVAAAAFLLAAVPLHEVALSLTHNRPRGTPIDASLAPIARALPPGGEVGWDADPPSGHETMAARLRLQFALAPRLVVARTTGVAAVVAWAQSEEGLERLLREHRLAAFARLASGYALCGPRGP